jgi:hypothetical protein
MAMMLCFGEMCVARTLIDLPTFAGSKQPTQRNDEETITHACSHHIGNICIRSWMQAEINEGHDARFL